MDNINTTAAIIVRIMGDKTRSADMQTLSVETLVKDAVVNTLNVFKNITDTSLGSWDRDQRIIDLCKKSGIEYSNNSFH